ncbi:MAG: ISLre2 family transposase, partial [Clostridiales bacterium]|nr:ISLre2 family transposase [Clostridiales bacterium]
MENIILQIVTEAAKKILEYHQGNGLSALHRMAEDIKAITDGMAAEMLKAFIGAADRALADAREERMGDGIRIRQSNVPRTLLTALGPLTYRRTYFDVKDRREYILDRILEVDAYDRIDAGVGARLVNGAAKASYGRSAETFAGGRVSRQTVKNKVMNTGEAAYVPTGKAETPEAVHIFADEDHVSLHDGKSVIVPLVTVCEGRRKVSEGRFELTEPFHIQGFGMKPDKLWEYVYAVCAEKYDMGGTGNVYLYGDGAAWIETGTDFFPGAVRVLDEFHLKSRMRRLLAGDTGAALAPRARNALARGDRGKFGETVGFIADATLHLMPEGREREGRLKTVKETGAYILAHWDAIMNLRLPGSIGSCTEAMVSHVLSERFSRNPMGWSREGLSKMAMIRVFVINGGRIKPADVTATKGKECKGTAAHIAKYEMIARKQQEEALKGMRDWGLFDRETVIPGKPCGTRVAVAALGRTRQI